MLKQERKEKETGRWNESGAVGGRVGKARARDGCAVIRRVNLDGIMNKRVLSLGFGLLCWLWSIERWCVYGGQQRRRMDADAPKGDVSE